ncbi:glycosyltransferase [Sphingomonas sp. MG17]|uniref:Glycosyltransferase n=1 Tax=Sphingomonas tagetis TaxID=2949092 RepID=A0A9X2HSX4_9SPHN|nr:glycosyltransferase family 2 protein [Sphingomonas tagetis]MCP3732903.1 glycosyltransferase [Sphingomonas tagetis]
MPQNDPAAPRVSIITVVFNARALLEQTIAAIDVLDYPDIEHVIIDGGSTDGTTDILNRDRRVTVRSLSEPDRGIYDAMNKGIHLASGDYLWFLNAGDSPATPDVLKALLTGPSPDVLYGDTNLIDEQGRLSNVAKAPATLSSGTMIWGMRVSHQSIMFRRSIVPLYDLQYSYIADQKWIVDALKKADTTLHISGPMSNYLLGGLSQKSFHKFWFEKVRYSFNDRPLVVATCVTFKDLFLAARFYLGALVRGS